jgi:NADH:ubiquinone oxidoreductase subunit F (NADH-binding)
VNTAELSCPPSDRHSSRGRLLPMPGQAPQGLPAHEQCHGTLATVMHSPRWVESMMTAIETSGLQGRGGAAFPMALKLAAVQERSRRPIVVANGTEGEPASFKDRVLLTRSPHLVLDGLSLVGNALHAREAVIVVHEDARASVDDALAERSRTGCDRVAIRAVTAAPGFVAGEASAVVNWIDRSRPLPLGKSPRMSEKGVAGRPTLVQNVETLAHVALIARHGAPWFRRAGTDDEPGTMLVTLLGAVAQPGVFEVEIGMGVEELLALAGGPSSPPQALLVGGYFGTWVPYRDVAGRPFSARGLGAELGAGLVAVLPASACGIVETANLARYLAGESAGQCGPCKFGLPAIADELIVLAERGPAQLGDLYRWLAEVKGRGACGHPDGVAAHIESALRVFGAEVDEHRRGRCSATSPEPLLPTPNRPRASK